MFVVCNLFTNRAKSSNEPMPLKRRRPSLLIVICSCWLGILLGRGIQVLIDRLVPPQTGSFPRATAHFHSTQPNQTVTVRFALDGGGIVAVADFSGTSLPCLVDSGAREVATNLDLHCPGVGNPINYPSPNGIWVPAKFVQVPHVALGGYELSKVPVVSMADSGTPPAYVRSGVALKGLLGNYAFHNAVLTIDYQQQLLMVRPASYDVTHEPRRKQDALLDLTFHGDRLDFAPELITARGYIEEQPVDFVIDTGNCSDGLLISPALRQRLTKVASGTSPRSRYNMFGQWVSEETRPLHWTLGNASGWTPGLTIPMRSDTDVWLGYEALKNYRVTIDYPRKKLLLEPYDPMVQK